MPLKIVLFTLPKCPASKAARSWLTQQRIDFSEYDLSDVDVQQELRDLEKRAQRRLEHTPVSVINGKVFEGFDPNAYEQILSAELDEES
jgi:glutaredoxin